MKSTELIKGKWYITSLGWIIKYKKKSGSGNSTIITEYINGKYYKSFEFEGKIGASVLYPATIDDFPDEFKYLFNDTITEPNYEVY